jgi:hypothetical protein
MLAKPAVADESPPRTTLPVVIPAWLLSLALHMLIVLFLSVLVRGGNLPTVSDEPPRATSIVVARTASIDAAPQYFADDEPAAAAQPREPGHGLANGADLAVGSPTAIDPPASGIELPGRSGEGPGPALLAIGPTAKPGHGRSRMGGLSDADVAAILAEEAARPRNVGPTGPQAQLSLFGSAPAKGRSFVFLIDRSASMGHAGLGAIAAAAKELATSIDALGPEHKFQVIAYNQKPLSLGGGDLLPATPENKRKLIDFVANTVAFGATEHELGLFAALRYKPEVIFLLTDGGDPELKPGQLRSIRDAAAGRTEIHCLHFGSGPQEEDDNVLMRLAQQTGGSYLYIDMRK